MSKTRIFVSSTCYDLEPVREEIRNCILNLGHEPWLSEFPSFPVISDLTTTDNCRRNIRNNTDIFVLIIGGRRGSLDKISNKPITNIEYEEARRNKLDIIVFVSKPVMQLISVWEKNATADFTPHVDYPEVFKFIKDIKDNEQWIFPFDRIAEIKEILTTQLSNLLKFLIDKKKEGKLVPIKEFLSESDKAQQIALEKPGYWEYLLTTELLSSKIAIY